MDFQLDTLRRSAQGNSTMTAIFKHWLSLDKTFTRFGVRSMQQHFRKMGARSHTKTEIVNTFRTLEACGLGKYVPGPNGKEAIINLPLPVNEIGALVVGDDKNLRVYKAAQSERGVEAAAAIVKSAPGSLKVYPGRQAGHLSITLNIEGTLVSLIIPDGTPIRIIEAIYERLRKTDDANYGK